MAAKKKKNDPSVCMEGGGMDLTPMIDCTFQLIIFFMICTEISDTSKTQMELPSAEKAIIDEPERGRLILNIQKDGSVVHIGKPYNLERKEDRDALKRILQIEQTLSMDKGSELPTRAVLIRADKEVEFGYVHQVLGLCMEHKLWRIAFATKDQTGQRGP